MPPISPLWFIAVVAVLLSLFIGFLFLKKSFILALAEHLHLFSQKAQSSHLSNIEFIQRSVRDSLDHQSHQLSQKMQEITLTTERHLTGISHRVEQRLNEGFEKTTHTFTQVIERLAVIDEAQKKISQLSNNLISLQEVLSDKKARGAFGEVQLAALVRDVMPERTFAFQHTLSNGCRADCMLFLPDPTGHIVIDSKFPLENYRNSHNMEFSEERRLSASQQFKRDVQKHIQDVQQKYILQPETADGAILFIPAESVFADIHANYQECVEMAHRARVWIVSPTTMMAILTTACAVLKDAATRKQVHIIQEHLVLLSKDFERFEKRMDALTKNIERAHIEAEQVHTSARKITARFDKIEKVDLDTIPTSVS